MTKVLFVCLGNICRSPTAHGIFEQMLIDQGLSGQLSVDSAGTMGYHKGSAPDLRSQQTALSRGIDLSTQHSRPVEVNDFAEFDYILAMDSSNLRDLKALFASLDSVEKTSHISLLLDFSHHWNGKDVPDPYYGGARGFEDVFEMVEDGCRGLLAHIQKNDL